MAIAEVMNKERLGRYILEAAKAAGYEDSFGIMGCDLNLKHWWAAYTRQSTREQTENDRLGEYLLTCARLAKQNGGIVPREYVVYDAESSEDLNRLGMIWLRKELIAGRRIAGVVIPFQGRLSADPLHQLAFERECAYYGVRIVYGDAPAGQDWASQTTRLIQAQANALRVKCNRDNALAGNIARVLAGKVPAHRGPYGYIYRAEKIIEARTGRAKVLRAWWEIDELEPDGQPVWGSPAWVVIQIFVWIGDEGRTAYWVASKLNELRIQPPYGTSWAPKTVIKIAGRKCYTGKAEYNANGRVPNPEKPLGDLTLGIKRTLVRPKPGSEKVTFEVPALITEEQWLRANNNLRQRGRGRGKQGKSIRALFRTRMLCPKCRKPMSVLQKKGSDQVYYYCRAHYCPWLRDPCTFNRFVPGTWDDEIWEEICAMLSDDAWLEWQLAAELSQSADLEKLIRMEQFKISQAKLRVSKVQEGWEKGFYTPEEVQIKLTEHREAIARAESEIGRLRAQMANRGLSAVEAELLWQELKALRDQNLRESTFEERADLIAKLGIKILPSEDLKSRKIFCRLNLAKVNEEREQAGFAKVTFGVALGYRRHGLLPHPVQVAVAEKVKVAIEKALEDATDVVISHYHGEHHPMVNANPYQLSADRVAKSLRHPRLWTKGTQDLSPTQVHRAEALAQKVGRALPASEGLNEGCLSFSLPVPHGQRGIGGTVMMTRIEEGSEVFVHASDIQMLSDEAIEQILGWRPTMVLASGPPIYLPSMTWEKKEGALRRALVVAREVDMVILDHHLMRSREGEKWLDWVSSHADHQVICAADFMGRNRNLLEAERVGWYKKMLVPKGWHEAYARGEANTEAYQVVR